jgi:hypothetical protein
MESLPTPKSTIACNDLSKLTLNGLIVKNDGSSIRDFVYQISIPSSAISEIVYSETQDGKLETANWGSSGVKYFAEVSKVRNPKIFASFPPQLLTVQELSRCFGKPSTILLGQVRGPEGSAVVCFLIYPSTGKIYQLSDVDFAKSGYSANSSVSGLYISVPELSDETLSSQILGPKFVADSRLIPYFDDFRFSR